MIILIIVSKLTKPNRRAYNFKAYNLYLQSDHRFLIDKIHVISLDKVIFVFLKEFSTFRG